MNESLLHNLLKIDVNQYLEFKTHELEIPQIIDGRLEIGFLFQGRPLPKVKEINLLLKEREYIVRLNKDLFHSMKVTPDEYIDTCLAQIKKLFRIEFDEVMDQKIPENYLKMGKCIGLIDTIKELNGLKPFSDLFYIPEHAPIALEALAYFEVIGSDYHYLHGGNDKGCISAWFQILHCGQIIKLSPDDFTADLINRKILGLNITGKTLRNRKPSRANNETYAFHLKDRLSRNLPLK